MRTSEIIEINSLGYVEKYSNTLTLPSTKVGGFLLLAQRLRSNGCATTRLTRPSLKGTASMLAPSWGLRLV
ncbi:MAG: hypothetical protein ACUVXA_11285 [Candidatus Jordarchaeum sp.]|uniref:hypothetical protein n=1 Tax=Candidatus Jordarchaeum sp. TaxID=2823881 RepID=UPI004049E7D7